MGGYNIELYSDKTVAECQQLCIEYGVDHGGALGDYSSKDCQLQSSADQTGCDGAGYNLDFYTRPNTETAAPISTFTTTHTLPPCTDSTATATARYIHIGLSGDWLNLMEVTAHDASGAEIP